ncbi:Uncharacterised protein [uncultured archaeon]|nr:Uncharacterised protein [uncultured archaeon]
MKISYILAALVAMLCLAGFAAATDVTVTGSVSSVLRDVSVTPATISGVILTPGTTVAVGTITVSGTTNGATITATSDGFVPALGANLKVNDVNFPQTYDAAFDPDTGSFTKTLVLTQYVSFSDAAYTSRTATVGVTVTAS